MTITYSLDISSSTFLGIHRLLFRWRGSIWKSILPELICWLITYFALSISYRYAMNEAQRRYFEQLCKFFGDYIEYIPITFMLGFYVSAVFGRWNQIFDNLGWIDSPALLIATYVRGMDEEARRIRRNIVRYLILTQAMVYRDISSGVQKRFPTMDHLVTAGFMTANELKEFDAVPSANIKYWTPIQWAFLLLQRAKDKKMIESDIIYTDMLEKVRQFRVNVLTLTLYDWIPIPLVYTQVVNLAVRSYFIVALFGRQYMLENVEEMNIRKTVPDLFVPIMTILQFLFYIGWIKVAEVLLNPLGEDDDDFETNWIIDRNLQVGLSIVDDCYGRVPALERDVFWEKAVPEPLYTPESAARPHNPMIGSCNDVSGQEDALLIQPRRRRLMSAMTSYDNTAFFKQSGTPSITVETEEGIEIVPVENHNPSRRISVTANSFNESTHGRLLDSVRRKFSKASNSRRGSISSTTDFDRTLNGRLMSSDDTIRRQTPRGSFAATYQSDLLPVSFTQSLNLNHQRIFRQSISGISSELPQKINETVNSQTEKSICENDDDDETKSTYQCNTWAMNESMLPIIEEVQERMRRNARDTESMHSTDSSIILSRPSSRKRTNGKSLPPENSFDGENLGCITTRGEPIDVTDQRSEVTTDATITLASTVTATEATLCSFAANQNEAKDGLKLIDENEEYEEHDDDEPPMFSTLPSPQYLNDRKYRENESSETTLSERPEIFIADSSCDLDRPIESISSSFKPNKSTANEETEKMADKPKSSTDDPKLHHYDSALTDTSSDKLSQENVLPHRSKPKENTVEILETENIGEEMIITSPHPSSRSLRRHKPDDLLLNKSP